MAKAPPAYMGPRITMQADTLWRRARTASVASVGRHQLQAIFTAGEEGLTRTRTLPCRGWSWCSFHTSRLGRVPATPRRELARYAVVCFLNLHILSEAILRRSTLRREGKPRGSAFYCRKHAARWRCRSLCKCKFETRCGMRSNDTSP